MRHKILKLNKFYLPLGTAPWKEVVKNIFSVAVYPLDIQFEEEEDGTINFESIDNFTVVKSLEDWLNLPVRPYDEFINSPKRVMRLPSVVVCSEYDQLAVRRALFPTKKNIWERDKFTCGYSGKKLTRAELSVDHVFPKSRCREIGIEPNTWENLVTCSKVINNEKDNRTPAEAGLKLQFKPGRPKTGWVFDDVRDQWRGFLGE